MTELIKNIPPKSSYKKSSEKVFFSYPGDQTHFQTGYYGVTPNVLIAGNLHLRFPSSDPLLVTKIELVFKGIEKVKWTEHRGESTITHTAKEIFVNKLLQLWTSSKLDGNYEEIQNMDIPFEIQLPEILPPSIIIDKGEGKIRYKLIAIIKRKGNLWKLQGSEKSVELNIDLDKYSLPSNLPPFNWNQLNDYKAMSRGLGYDVTLVNSIGGPNMPFIINFHLKFHKQDIRVTKISFGIKEYHELITKRNKKRRSFFLTEKFIKGEEIKLDPNGEVTTQIKLEIPADKKFCWTLERKHIKVNHKVKIKIHFGGILTSNIKMKNEVQIKNILFDSNYYGYNDNGYNGM